MSAAIALTLLLWLTAFAAPALFAQARGPVLRVTPDPFDFDTTLCGTTKCGSITFRNVGDTTLRVHAVNGIAPPFSGTIVAPFELAPGSARTFPVCYTPATADAVDSQRVRFRADTRVSLSIGTLFDVSGSMDQPIGSGDATPRIDAAHSAGRSFFDNLLNTPEIRDEAAVFQFAASGDFQVRQGWTSDRTLLRNAVPSTAPGTNTCLYRAIAQTAAHVATRANRRVLIVLTDGGDACDQAGATVMSAISAAQSANVRVFTIGIGTANAGVLEQIATATGGRYFTATSMSDLVGVYRTIATLLSQNIEGSFALRGRAVSPYLVVEPGAVSFDSTRVGTSRCQTLVLRNTGTAPLTIDGIDGLDARFAITSLPSMPIAPGATASVEVCFAPDRLRVLTAMARVRHNSCRQDAVELPLTGIGYDSLTLAVRGTFTARPGSIVEIPVTLEQVLPAHYDVNALTFTVAYNKTLLYPADRFIVLDGTAGAAMTTASHGSAFGSTEASTRVELDGATLSTAAGGETIVRLAFQVLHGNALATDVRITEATFADGNPRAGWIDSAVVTADSLCYQADRLIDASDRYGRIFQRVLARPGAPTSTAYYTIATAAATRMTLHDALGREVLRIVDAWLEPGEHAAEIDMSSLMSGNYFLRVESGREADVRMITVTR